MKVLKSENEKKGFSNYNVWIFCYFLQKLPILKALISLEKIPSTLEDFQTQGKLAKKTFNQISASNVRQQKRKTWSLSVINWAPEELTIGRFTSHKINSQGLENASYGHTLKMRKPGLLRKKSIFWKEKSYPARALSVLWLLLADGAPTVGWGKTFCSVGQVPLTKTAVTRKKKVEKLIRRCQIDRHGEGYKCAIYENRGPFAKK